MRPPSLQHPCSRRLAGEIPKTVFGLANGDKLLGAVPTWLALFAINLYFAKTYFGSLLLPWDIKSTKGKVSPPTTDRSDTSETELLSGANTR